MIFIEGLTRETLSRIRIECARGLAKLGPQTFKALLLGLKENNDEVRNETANAIF